MVDLMRRRAGFSLMEMVVTLAVLGMVTFFLTDLLVRQSRTYQVVDDVSEAQQSLRAVGGLLERDLRSTGFLVPAAAAICGWDMPAAAATDQTPDVLYVTDADAIDPTGVSSVTAQAAKVTGGFTGAGVNSLVLSTLVVDANGFYDLDGNGVGDSDFLYTAVPQRNGAVIVVDRADPAKGAACGVITNINTATKTVTVDFEVKTAPHSPPAGAAPGGTQLTGVATDLVAVPAHVYWVNPGPPPQLIRDGMVLANDVEDLQIAFFYDKNNNGVVDGLDAAFPAQPAESATEYPGSSATNSRYSSKAWDNSQLREVRVTVVGRTRAQDPDVVANPTFANSVTQAIENRPQGAVADGFRRRTLTITAKPRNVNRVL
jgi:prepilin-type N-terminal cleavage/methylation domain-containing protein